MPDDDWDYVETYDSYSDDSDWYDDCDQQLDEYED
jgi:hypothetical protein